MERRALSISGRVYQYSGEGIYGAIAQVYDVRSNETYGESVTGKNGRYRIQLPPGRLINAVKNKQNLAIRINDKDGATYGSKKQISLEREKSNIYNFRLSKAKLKRFKPEGKPIERVSGPLLDLQGFRLIDAAIAKMIPRDGPGYGRYINAARCTIPIIQHFKSIVADSLDVLDGDMEAEHRLRLALDMMYKYSDDGVTDFSHHGGWPSYSDPGMPGGRMGEPLPLFGEPMKELGFEDSKGFPGTSGYQPSEPRILPPDRFLPVVGAIIRIAKDEEDAHRLQTALDTGLNGVLVLEGLQKSAIEALGTGEFDRMKGILDNLVMFFDPSDELPPCPPWPPDPPEPPEPPERIDPRQIPPKDLIPYFILQEMKEAILVETCKFMMARYLRALAAARENYMISSVSPENACPGETLTIYGIGFGEEPGLVCFPSRDPSAEHICVEPTRWTDTTIVVTVPQNAGSGSIGLKVLEATFNVCGKIYEIYKLGLVYLWGGHRSSNFEGGRPRLTSLSIDGRDFRFYNFVCVEPDTVATIAWTSLRNSNAEVEIQVLDGTTIIHSETGLPSTGTTVYRTPSYSVTSSLTVKAIAKNRCGTNSFYTWIKVTVRPVLQIHGIELTQGIQTAWRTGVTWNSNPLIKGKDTVARVYVSSDMGGFENDEVRISGKLIVGSHTLSPINGYSPDNPSAINPFIIARPHGNIDREETDHTLNFRIPASYCTGLKGIKVEVWDASWRCTYNEARADLATNASWQNNNSLPVRYVRIRDDRPGGTGQRPSRAEAAYTIRRAFDLFPTVGTVGRAPHELHETTHDFRTFAGLGDLLDDIALEKIISIVEWLGGLFTGGGPLSGEFEYWVGLTSPYNMGLGYRPGTVCISAVYELADGQTSKLRIKTGHELGHNLDFMHVNVGCGDTPDGPFYDHPNGGLLKNVPFDPYWNVAIDSNVHDFMSYGCSRWVSSDSWDRLIDAIPEV